MLEKSSRRYYLGARSTQLVSLRNLLCDKEFLFVRNLFKKLKKDDEVSLILFSRNLQQSGYSIQMVDTIRRFIEKDYKVKWI